MNYESEERRKLQERKIRESHIIRRKEVHEKEEVSSSNSSNNDTRTAGRNGKEYENGAEIYDEQIIRKRTTS